MRVGVTDDRLELGGGDGAGRLGHPALARLADRARVGGVGEAERGQRRRHPRRTPALPRAFAEAPQRLQRVDAQRLEAQQHDVLGDRLGKTLGRLEDAGELDARLDIRSVRAHDDAQLVDGAGVRSERPAPERGQPQPPRARAGRDLEVAGQRRGQPRGLVEPDEERVEAIDRQVVPRIERQRLLERLGGPLRILGRARQQLAERHQVTDARLRLRLDRGQPAEHDGRLGEVAPPRQPPDEPRQRGELVGRRQERVAVGLDRLIAVGQRPLGDVSDADPGRAHRARIGRGGDGMPVGGDRLGVPPEVGLHLGQPQQHRHRARIELDRLGEHGRRLDGIARVDQLRQREQPVAPLGRACQPPRAGA